MHNQAFFKHPACNLAYSLPYQLGIEGRILVSVQDDAYQYWVFSVRRVVCMDCFFCLRILTFVVVCSFCFLNKCVLCHACSAYTDVGGGGRERLYWNYFLVGATDVFLPAQVSADKLPLKLDSRDADQWPSFLFSLASAKISVAILIAVFTLLTDDYRHLFVGTHWLQEPPNL